MRIGPDFGSAVQTPGMLLALTRPRRTGTAWHGWTLLQFALDHDLNVTANYQEMDRRMDLANFADYLLLNIYGDTRDWTQNNWRSYRERIAEGKFRFTLWDAEFAMGLGDDVVTSNNITNPNELGNPSTDFRTQPVEIPVLYRKLKANREFRLLFADRIQKHFFNNGALTKPNILKRFEALRQTMLGVIPAMPTYIPDYWVPQREASVMQQFTDALLRSTVVAPTFNQLVAASPRVSC